MKAPKGPARAAILQRYARVCVVRLDIVVPSKKNRYEVHFSRAFYSSISYFVAAFRKRGKRIYWIDSHPDVKLAEEAVAWKCKMAIKENQSGPLRLDVLINTRADLDNVLGVLLDGLEKSGKIVNDRQIDELRVMRSDALTGVKMELFRILDLEE